MVNRLKTVLNRDAGEIETLIDALCKAVKNSGSELDSIAIPGFGTFKSEKRDEYVKEDAATGVRTLCPPEISITFQPSIIMRKKLTR